MTGDDRGGFRAPEEIVVPTPTAVKAAGRRLLEYARANNIDQPLLTMELVGTAVEVAGLAQDQRFLSWFLALQEGNG